MKILDRNKKLNEDQTVEKRSTSMFESYNRCPSKKHFLRENGDTKIVNKLFNTTALVETYADKSKLFLFECGILLPSIGTKMEAPRSLKALFESAQNESEFVELVEDEIYRPMTECDLTDGDRERLVEEYNRFKK